MRLISGLFLITLVAVLAFLAYDNNRATELNAWTFWSGTVQLPLLIGVTYLLGMVSGWWMVGLMKRSWQRVTEPDRATA